MDAFENTLTEMTTQGLRNGMSFKQIHARIPTLCAQRVGITLPEFHERVNALELKDGFVSFVYTIVNSFTPAEQQTIARRK